MDIKQFSMTVVVLSNWSIMTTVLRYYIPTVFLKECAEYLWKDNSVLPETRTQHFCYTSTIINLVY